MSQPGRHCIVCGKPGGTPIARVGYAHGGKCARIAMDRAGAPPKEPGFGPRAWFFVFSWMRRAQSESDRASVVSYNRASNHDKKRREDIERVIEARGWAEVLPDGRRKITRLGIDAIAAVAKVAEATWPSPRVDGEGAAGLDDGQCDRCDGSGHSQTNDGQLCDKCGGTGRLDDLDDEEEG